MQPSSNVKFDTKSFNIIKKTIGNISAANRGRKGDSSFATQLPVIVGLKLTNRCNLRCRHCYEWNDEGYHRNMAQQAQNAEMPLDIIQKIMKETREVKSNLYLWGGEPLYYGHFKELAEMIEEDNRITAICTNGIALEQQMDSILKIGPLLELLIPLEGFEEENDAIRGGGTYKIVVKAVDTLMELRRKNIFKGKVSLHIVINAKMLGKLSDFISFFEQKGVDSIFLCFPWYISDDTSFEMNSYFEQNFEFLNQNRLTAKYSWDAFKYGLDVSYTPAVIEEMKKIMGKEWKIRVRFQPDLKFSEVHDFLDGKYVPAQGRSKCLSISTRMDVLPDGSVSSCKHFPEFAIGSLEDMSVKELWNCEKFKEVRKVIDNGLMPVCSKCNNLYLHGY
jgi:radical SAM protein with 4Fe4S-binding SPASM domain